jgi:hypothetical protein
MIRPTRLAALTLLVCGSLSLAACKKNDDPQAVPIPSASAPAPVANDAPPAGGTATAGTAAATAATPPVNTAPVQQQPIDACCAALAAIAKSGKTAADKQKAGAAAGICTGIAALVKSGKTQRAGALSQIRSSLGGVTAPTECH